MHEGRHDLYNGLVTDVDLMLRVLLQILVVLGTCKIVGWLGVRFLGQTQVVMEMLAGVALGPSLFGIIAPKLQAWLFPINVTYVIDGVTTTAHHPSMVALYIISQLGLILYMFNVGLEFNHRLIEHRAKGAISISIAGIAAPFVLGVVIAAMTFHGWGLFDAKIYLLNACIFFGAAMCITAFPMLARIIYEQGISATSMGTLALGAGAVDDAVAWSILAVVLAASKGSMTYAVYAIGGGALFAFLVLKFAGPIFARLSKTIEETGEMPQSIFVTTLLFVFLGAFITDAIGVYAFFGAFLIGIAMPRGRFVDEIRKKTESLTVGLLLPFFFVYSGLNTSLGLIDSAAMAGLTLVVIIAAIAGKGIACALAARASGEGWSESVAIGTLMNARGLMELIILNIGIQQGVITQRFYTIMVVMAIVTTLMASPIFRWIFNRHLVHLVVPTGKSMEQIC
ncbi:cation:proton antiporter [soil metagenome]